MFLHQTVDVISVNYAGVYDPDDWHLTVRVVGNIVYEVPDGSPL